MVYLRLGDTPFRETSRQLARELDVEVAYAYDDAYPLPAGTPELTLTRKPTAATLAVYEDTATAQRVIGTVEGTRRVYVDETTAARSTAS